MFMLVTSNGGLLRIRQICDVIKGDTTVNVDYSPSTVACFSYAPVTSVDVGQGRTQGGSHITKFALFKPESILKIQGYKLESRW